MGADHWNSRERIWCTGERPTCSTCIRLNKDCFYPEERTQFSRRGGAYAGHASGPRSIHPGPSIYWWAAWTRHHRIIGAYSHHYRAWYSWESDLWYHDPIQTLESTLKSVVETTKSPDRVQTASMNASFDGPGTTPISIDIAEHVRLDNGDGLQVDWSPEEERAAKRRCVAMS